MIFTWLVASSPPPRLGRKPPTHGIGMTSFMTLNFYSRSCTVGSPAVKVTSNGPVAAWGLDLATPTTLVFLVARAT